MEQRLKKMKTILYLIVKRAIKEAKDNREVQLHVHPIHYQYLLSKKEELVIHFS